ncbi:MAG: adenine phosphoribosyltransferase [Proteobacteria bacterium]|nr:adenine phosphoribosyltransferase [Pseudomonadota bacterium]
MQDLERYIVDTKDFPKKGVTFKDVSPLLKEKLRETISAFAALFDKEILDKTDYIAGIDSRGFVFGSALAQHLGKGFIMIRKAGKLPPPTVSEKYSLEYGTAEIEMSPGSGGVIIIDDVLATGGTLAAAANLCKRAGYDVLDIAVLLDLKFLNNFSWQGLKAKSLIQYYDNDILIVMALESECQGYFAKENVIYTGVGKTNASYALMKAINKKKPKLVLNLGSAGSAVFNKGELINCIGFIQRDMDASGLGFKKYVTPFDEGDEQILRYGDTINGLKQGICGTGDSFDTSANKDAAYNLVDMESYALAKICKAEEIPFLCIKYITDGADGGAANDWNLTLEMAAESLFEFFSKELTTTDRYKIKSCIESIKE